MKVTYLPGPDVKAESLDGVDLVAVRDAATAADAIVVCVGEETYTEKPGDIDTLDLPAGQPEVTHVALLSPIPSFLTSL